MFSFGLSHLSSDLVTLAVSVMSDGDNSLWSVSELWVQNKDWHDNDKSNESCCQDVDDQGLLKGFLGVPWVFTCKLRFVIPQVVHPFWIGNTVRSELSWVDLFLTESEECLFDEACAWRGHGHDEGRDAKRRMDGH